MLLRRLSSALFFACAVTSTANAACTQDSATRVVCDTQGEAYEAASQAAQGRGTTRAQQLCSGWYGGTVSGVGGVIPGMEAKHTAMNFQLTAACSNGLEWGNDSLPNSFVALQSCATQPEQAITWTGGDASLFCKDGCELRPNGSLCAWANGTYQCVSNRGTPTGKVCNGSGPLDLTPPEPEPEPEEPEPEEPEPEEPDPEEPDPEEPDPEEPDPPGGGGGDGGGGDGGGGGGDGGGGDGGGGDGGDGGDGDGGDGESPPRVDMSGVEARLDALKSSVDVIPPRLDAIASAINRAGRCVGRGPGDGVVDECDNMASPNPEGNTVSGGGDCSSPPVCTGDAAQCAMVVYAWRNQCSTERIADALEGDGDGNGEGGPTTPGPDLSEHAQDPDTDGLVESIWQDSEDAEVELDTGGLGASRSCPLYAVQLPAWMGPMNWGPTCNILAVIGHLAFAISALWGLSIVWRH